MPTSMTACEACNETISTQAKACPKCGHPVSRPRALFRWLFIASLVLWCAAIAYTVQRASATSTLDSEIESAASDVDRATNGAEAMGAQTRLSGELDLFLEARTQRNYGLGVSVAIGPLALVLYLFRRREARTEAALAIGRERGTS